MGTRAEHDLLPRIDVVSTVSGGAIVGAYLQLKIRQLLEQRRERALFPDGNGHLELEQGKPYPGWLRYDDPVLGISQRQATWTAFAPTWFRSLIWRPLG